MFPRHIPALLLILCSLHLTGCLCSPEAKPVEATGTVESTGTSITDFGAKGDGRTLNTEAIQKTIDHLAAKGGGTVVVPSGIFVSGALFFKPGVNLHLEKNAVLRCSTDMANFPPRRTRIEGHFEENFTPGFINAEGCDNLRINGMGTLEGDGRPVWDHFWKLRRASEDPKNFPNLSVQRARLCYISNSKNVVIDGITFKDSQFWNLHLYKCQNVLVQNVRFQVPDDYKQAPSTDGIDVDSSQDVTISGCHFSITDDCIAMKGSKGPHALDDTDSPPVERVKVSNCVFRRGHAMVTLGSEATIVRHVMVQDCRVEGSMSVLNFKLRSDTPQHYEDIHYSGLTLDSSGGALVSIRPWSQFSDLKDQTPPQSVVRNVTLSNITGRYGSFGTIRGNRGQTTIGDILLKDINIQLKNPRLGVHDVNNLRYEHVLVNGQPVEP